MWDKDENASKEESLDIQILVKDDKGKDSAVLTAVNAKITAKRQRFVLAINFRVIAPGVHHILIQAKKNNHWVNASSIPIEIIYNPDLSIKVN